MSLAHDAAWRRHPVLAWLNSDYGRRLGGCLIGGVIVCLMTDTGQGNSDVPAHEGRLALLSVRLPVCLLLALGVWALWVYGSAGIRSGAARLGQTWRSSGADRIARTRPVKSSTLLVVLLLAIGLPRLFTHYFQSTLTTQVAPYILLALGLNVVVGFAGLLDLGYIAFYAIGAYTTAYFTSATALPHASPFILNPFLVLPIALVVAMLAGIILGGPTLRLRGDYLAIVTLGFGEIVRISAINAQGLTNGANGAFNVPPMSFHLFGVKYTWGLLDDVNFWYLQLGLIVIVVFLLSRLENSRIGRGWTAIREDEVAAESSGVPTLRYKLLAFAIGASTSGIAGVLFATKQGSFEPNASFVLQNSLLVLVAVIFGGMGSIPGVIVGAAILQFLPNVLKSYVPAVDQPVYYGAILVLMMIFRPQGLIPSRRRQREIALAEEGLGGADALGKAP